MIAAQEKAHRENMEVSIPESIYMQDCHQIFKIVAMRKSLE